MSSKKSNDDNADVKSRVGICLLPVPFANLPHFSRLIIPDLKGVLKRSEDEQTVGNFLENVKSGLFSLWMILIDSEYGGFLVTEVIHSGTRSWVNIVYAFSSSNNSEFSERVRDICYGTIESYARSFGFNGVKFVTSRPGFERVGLSRGYKKRFVEYVKLFDDEESEG